MNNSHGHVLVLHLQFHEGVRTFREVASVRHIMRSISVSCSRQRFKAGMVDLRVGRKAGGDRRTWSSNEPFSWTPREQLDDIDMIFRNGPMVTALDLLGLSERVSARWCIVGRCWKMLEDVGRKKYHVQTWPMWFEGSSLTISTQTKEQGSWWIRVKNTRRKLQNYFDHLTFVSRHHLEFWTLKLVLKVKCS